MLKSFNEILSEGKINLDEIEKYRRSQLKKLTIDSAIFLLVLVFVAMLIYYISITSGYLVANMLSFFGLLPFFIWLSWRKNKLKKRFKTELIGEISKKIDSSLVYKPNDYISKDLMKLSNTIKSWSIYVGEDYFSGTINGVKIQFSELDLKVSSGKSNRTVFKGAFFVMDFPENFSSTTSVIPDFWEGKFGNLGKNLQKLNLSRRKEKMIRFDNAEFDKKFLVYTQNEDEARRVLNKNFVNTLLIEQKKQGEGVELFFSFAENNIFYGINNDLDIFPISIMQPINQSLFQNFYDEFIGLINNAFRVYYAVETNLNFNTQNL